MSDEPQRLPARRDVALVEVLDRALGAGVVITGDVVLTLADIDLVDLSLRLVVGSVPTLRGPAAAREEPGVAP
ncbi:MAG TPA: gas vesicle protein [Conexibacter sp.]|nr:gas vesicle protein [Conexibacter sp.]